MTLFSNTAALSEQKVLEESGTLIHCDIWLSDTSRDNFPPSSAKDAGFIQTTLLTRVHQFWLFSKFNYTCLNFILAARMNRTSCCSQSEAIRPRECTHTHTHTESLEFCESDTHIKCPVFSSVCVATATSHSYSMKCQGAEAYQAPQGVALMLFRCAWRASNGRPQSSGALLSN